MKIVVAGGTGFIGSAVVKRLVADGHVCTVLIRDSRSSAFGHFPDNVRLAPYAALPDEADAVINLAGEIIAGRWNANKMARIRNSRIDITRLLVDWMSNLGQKPSVFLSTSAVGFYGDSGEEPITESEGPDSRKLFLSTVCLEWENEANRAAANGIRVVNMRIGHVLDPSGAMLKEMGAKFRRAPMIVPHATTEFLPWITLTDVVGIFRFCLNRETVSGPVNLVGPNPATWADFYDGLGHILGKRVVGRLPYWVLRIAVGQFAEALVDSQRVIPARIMLEGYSFKDVDLSVYLSQFRPVQKT